MQGKPLELSEFDFIDSNVFVFRRLYIFEAVQWSSRWVLTFDLTAQ